ncbi:hypothetical protein [Clostridium sp. CTA-6]
MQKVNLIPIMTSDITPSGECKVSSVDSSNYTQAFKAFDGDITTNWVNKYTSTSKWISYIFPSFTVVNELLFVYNNAKIYWNSVDLYGDNNLLCNISESEGIVIDNNNKQINKSFNNANRYKEYKLVFNSNNGDTANWIYIHTIEMYFNKKNKYLLGQNDQYYTIKSDFYKNGNYEPITQLEGKEILEQSDFETYGIDDLNLLTKTIDTQIINGVNKGNLSNGKLFEIPFNNDFMNISEVR